MLSIAYAKNQSDAVQIHKPEVCYPAQGFELKNKQVGAIEVGIAKIPAARLMTVLGQRREPVTYWTVVGDDVTRSGVDKKVVEIRYALKHRIPDGMLVRVSSIDGQIERAYDIHRQFASKMVAAIEATHRSRFVGALATSGTVAKMQ